MVLPPQTRQLIDPLKLRISQSTEPASHKKDEDDDCITSEVPANLRPRPTLNCGVISLPLPVEEFV